MTEKNFILLQEIIGKLSFLDEENFDVRNRTKITIARSLIENVLNSIKTREENQKQ